MTPEEKEKFDKLVVALKEFADKALEVWKRFQELVQSVGVKMFRCYARECIKTFKKVVYKGHTSNNKRRYAKKQPLRLKQIEKLFPKRRVYHELARSSTL